MISYYTALRYNVIVLYPSQHTVRRPACIIMIVIIIIYQKPKWERVQTGKIFSRYTKKWIETLIWSRGNVYIYPYMCFFRFIMFTKVICDNPDLINCIVPLVWYLKVTWKLSCIMVWNISKKLSSHESTHAHSYSSMNYVKLQWNEIKHIQNYVHHVIRWFRITNTVKERLVKCIYIVARYDVADVFIICRILYLLEVN